ncbi:MAG: UDP-N-acetylmuramoyl-tripeptide--D-alanyl-D-alanine ligase [Cryomorphaceae bacterium]|nr:UDP-N-acetylmuramoyl-tripeptide--D-alanyl-D-alanine ligase [Cryomorphaceae bacterium]
MNLDRIYQAYAQHGLVSTDSRNIPQGAVFFALKGPNFDGNQYAEEAINKGAIASVVDDPSLANEDHLIYVPDVLKALQALAVMHRKKLGTTVIGLTGSNGKTTSKELMHAVLKQSFDVLATEGNLNNHIGVPLSLLRLKPSHQIAIIEMGANGIGQIEELSALAQPDYGYITNFGKAHLEGFGSEEGVVIGKSELYQQLRRTNGTAIVNADDHKQIQQSVGINRVTFGENGDVKITGGISNEGLVYGEYYGVRIQSQLTGAYNQSNVAAAITLGVMFDMPLDKIEAGISEYVPTNNRSQWCTVGKVRVLLDAYNANPTSVEAALHSFARIPGNKWVVLGDMLELGIYSEEEHQKIADLAAELSFEKVLLVGPHFSKVLLPSPLVQTFDDTGSVSDYLSKQNTNHTFSVLLKGSRGMKMESLLSCFEQ